MQEVSKHSGGSWRALKWQHMPADRLKSSVLWLAVCRYPPFGLAEHSATFLTIYPKRWNEPPVMGARRSVRSGGRGGCGVTFLQKSSLCCQRGCSRLWTCEALSSSNQQYAGELAWHLHCLAELLFLFLTPDKTPLRRVPSRYLTISQRLSSIR